jgi:hypothetical protein
MHAPQGTAGDGTGVTDADGWGYAMAQEWATVRTHFNYTHTTTHHTRTQYSKYSAVLKQLQHRRYSATLQRQRAAAQLYC